MSKYQSGVAVVPSINEQVREKIRVMGCATIVDLRHALAHIDPGQVRKALERLVEMKDVVRSGSVEGQLEDGRKKKLVNYRYAKNSARGAGKLEHAKHKTLLDIQPRGAMVARTKGAVQRAPSGYPEGYFTALLSAPSEACPHGWPPRFEPASVRKIAPVAQLQTILRREQDSANGKGWGGGTTVMPGTTMQARPAFMGTLPGLAA